MGSVYSDEAVALIVLPFRRLGDQYDTLNTFYVNGDANNNNKSASSRQSSRFICFNLHFTL